MISFALATNTRLLIMDEPTNGLDIPSKSIFRKLLAQAATAERLVILSTHQVRDLHSLIDAVVILEQGKILLNASTEKISEKLVFQKGNEAALSNEIIYSEVNAGVKNIVAENTACSESQVDLELLFNAVLANQEKILKLFEK